MATKITFSSNKYYKSVAAGSTVRYVYKPSGGTAGVATTGAGFDFFASLDGATASDLVPLVVKWDDRAAVQGNCNSAWAVTVTGPIDIVIKDTNDTGSSCWEFV
jgi:hypothetical protein